MRAPRVGQKEPPRLSSTICYGQELAKKSHQDSAVRFVTAKSWPERATETRQYDLLRPRVGQKEPPRLGSTICYGQELARKSHRDSAVRFVTAKRGPERATKTRQYDLLRPRVGQKEPPRVGKVGNSWEFVGKLGNVGKVGKFVGKVGKFVGKVGKFVGKVGKFVGKVGKFVGKVGKFVGKVGKCEGKVGNSWAGREIRGQGRKFVGKVGKFVGKVGKFVGKVGNSWL